jgi:hypothetical protein
MKRSADDWSVKKEMSRKINWWPGGMTGESNVRFSIDVLLSQDAELCVNLIDYCALLNVLHCILGSSFVVNEPHCVWSCYGIAVN